jgi:hypothetical protein
MFFNATKDWKQYLSAEDEEKLNEILIKVAKYRGAYKNADDVKVAQLWCTILELRKENLILQSKMKKIEDVFEAMFEKVRKQEREREELAKSLERF